MATQACLDNIKKKNPPKYCGDNYCRAIQGDINEYCEHLGLGGDVPVPQNPESGKCWCCCSCLAWGTPVEVSKGTYKMVETIMTGDTVLATGGKVDAWEPRKVTSVGGIAPGVPLDFCYTAKFTLADGTERTIISTADHLYLTPDGTLLPVQDMRPGDKVMQADGKEATALFVGFGQFSGGVYNFSMGDFDPKKYPDDPYKGHLMNSFGLVTADLAVQMAYYQQEFAGELVAKSREHIPRIGTAAFFARYDTRAYQSFMTDPQQWPKGFRAASHESLLNIPLSALAYFTKEQSRDISQHNWADHLSNSDELAVFKYLKRLMQGFYPKYYYIADWTNDQANAWTFNDQDQTYIVLSGGLLRVPALKVPGLSMILCHLLAQAGGKTCTGDADYWGAALYFREIWYDELFFDMFEPALAQIEEIFAAVSPEHAKEDPNNICAKPSLDCRIIAIKNGGTFSGVPDCAKPPPAFAVVGAEATSLTSVDVTFSAKVFASTAEDPGHYRIISGGKVTAASVDAGLTKVTLTVEGLKAETDYKVVVTGVLSDRGQTLTKDHNQATFRTP